MGLQVVSAPVGMPTLAPKVQPRPVQPSLAPRVLSAPQNQPTLAPKVSPTPVNMPSITQVASAPSNVGKIVSIGDAQTQTASRMTASEFAQSIKSKYPEYQGIDDNTLAQKMLEKYPQYNDKVFIPSPQPEQQEDPKRGWLQSLLQPELTGIVSGLRAIQSTPDIVKSIFNFGKDFIKSDAATQRDALLHPFKYSSPSAGESLNSAQETMTKPINNVKPLAALNTKEALGLAGSAASQLALMGGAPVLSGTLFGGSDAALNNRSNTAILGHAALGGVLGKVADVAAPTISRAASSLYRGLVPEAAQTAITAGSKSLQGMLGDVGNVINPTLEKAVPSFMTKSSPQFVQSGIDTLEQGLSHPLDSALTGLGKVGNKILGPSAVNSLEQKYNELFTGTKSAKNVFNKSTAMGKDPAKFLAENGYVVNVEGGKINAQPVIDKIAKDAEPLQDTFRAILKQKDSMLPESQYISLDDIAQSAKARISTSTTKASGSLTKQKQAIDDLISELKIQYGDRINLSTLDEIKVGQWASSKSFNITKPDLTGFMGDVHYAVGSAAKDTLENNVEEIGVKKLNSTLGDHFDAIKNLQKVDGNAVKGGRLGRYFNRTLGSMIGMSGGPFGAITGAAVGDFVTNIMQSNAIAGPIKVKILSNIARSNPLYEEAQAALKELIRTQGLMRLPAPPLGAPKVQNNMPIELPSRIRPLENTSNSVNTMFNSTPKPTTLALPSGNPNMINGPTIIASPGPNDVIKPSLKESSKSINTIFGPRGGLKKRK